MSVVFNSQTERKCPVRDVARRFWRAMERQQTGFGHSGIAVQGALGATGQGVRARRTASPSFGLLCPSSHDAWIGVLPAREGLLPTPAGLLLVTAGLLPAWVPLLLGHAGVLLGGAPVLLSCLRLLRPCAGVLPAWMRLLLAPVGLLRSDGAGMGRLETGKVL